MNVSQGRLLYILFVSLVLGVFLGVVYDVFRIRRISYSVGKEKLKKNNIRERIETAIIAFEDVLYSLICSIVVCIFIFHTNSGKFRALALFGALSGFYIYYKTVGRLVIACSERIIRFVKYILRKIYTIFLLPLLHIVKFLIKITIGRLFSIVFTYIRLRSDMRLAEKGLGLLSKKSKGYIENEEAFKHIRKGSVTGVHRVLHSHHSKDAV